MITTASSPSYRPPQGRPRAVPPCDTRGPAIKVETDPRPVREPGESSGHYGARVGHWMDRQDPARKDARVAKRVATNRKNSIQKKREEAASTVKETATARWYTYAELAKVTGYSAPRMLQVTRERGWPIKKANRGGHRGSSPDLVFGNPYTLPTKPGRDAAPAETQPDPEPTEDLWLTYRAAGDRFGLTPDAVAARARRGGWPKRLRNDTGEAEVLMPPGGISPPVAEQIDSPRPSLWQRIKGWFA